jgi:hypothetical protein
MLRTGGMDAGEADAWAKGKVSGGLGIGAYKVGRFWKSWDRLVMTRYDITFLLST